MAAYVESLIAQLKSVAADLDSMTRDQAGSAWHRDRVDEARWLVAEIDRLTDADQDEDDEFIETWYCPACGELVIGDCDQCDACGAVRALELCEVESNELAVLIA
jgi:rubrerythrin